MMENTSTAEGWGGNSTFQLLAEEYRYVCIGRALPAKFQAENAAKCVIWSLKFQNFPGEHAPDPLALSGFALV